MKCPYCSTAETSVIDSREAEDQTTIRRRRVCNSCKKRFTTYERIEGIDLKILKKDKELKYIPTIILTTSSNQKDLLECYKTGIAGYVLKPLKYEDYVSKIDKLLAYWSINELKHI